jgi:hypothetical protein
VKTGEAASPEFRVRRQDIPKALAAFFKITEKWKLSTDEQIVLLGSPARSTYFKWKRAVERGSPPRDTLERISYLLGIYKALHILFPDGSTADAWITKPNMGPLFGGRSALNVMLGGSVLDLLNVRRYLDAQRGGWS